MKKIKVIAEFGVNHNGSLERAKEGIIAAARAGADAIKFQTYEAKSLVVKGTPKFWDWEGDKDKKTQYDAYEAIGGFPLKYYPELIQCCKENGIEFMSTPFSFEFADYLNSIGMQTFKIASSDMSHLPFLSHVAKFGKPMILSTGAATIDEIREAVETICRTGNYDISLLHCTLCYPTAPEDANLNLMEVLRKEFSLPVGVSDHTLGIQPAIIAAAMGAEIIEKHFTLDKMLPESADHWLSIDPRELQELVQGCRLVEKLQGSNAKRVFDCEKETRMYDKRSIVSAVPIKKGTKVTEDMLTFKRPGTGIWPKFLNAVIGQHAMVDIPEDTTLIWKMFG